MIENVNVVELGNKIYSFHHIPFDAKVDMDSLTMIHYHNIVGEIITIATLMNRVGNLKADADNAVREVKMDHRILEAQKSEYYRKRLTAEVNGKAKAPTQKAVDDAVCVNQDVRDSELNLYRVMKQADIVDSLYWSVKSKEMKLNQISNNIAPSDFEKDILEESINGVMIKEMTKRF
jgi:hypothetical protein